MPKAEIRIELGKDADEYAHIMDKELTFKRSTVKIHSKGGSILIQVDAADNVAVFSSINSALKQLRIISSVDKSIKKMRS